MTRPDQEADPKRARYVPFGYTLLRRALAGEPANGLFSRLGLTVALVSWAKSHWRFSSPNALPETRHDRPIRRAMCGLVAMRRRAVWELTPSAAPASVRVFQ